MTEDFFSLGLPARDARAEASDRARFISLQRVRGYWEGLIGPGGALPGPAALDPRGLLPALEDVFLAERIGTGLLRLRIAGRRVSAPAGVDMQGLPLSALFMPETRAALAQTVERVCTHHALVTMELQAEGGFGRPDLTARLLLLPLAAPLHGLPAVLGCFSTLGEVGRTPRRFTVTAVLEERLGHRIREASQPKAEPVELPDFTLPETPAAPPPVLAPRRSEAAQLQPEVTALASETENAPTEARPAEAPARPRLRLVHSSD